MSCFYYLGLHFSLITADDLILVDHTGMVVDGGKNRMLNYGKLLLFLLLRYGSPD